MARIFFGIAIYVAAITLCWANDQPSQTKTTPPSSTAFYRISFKQGEAVPGLGEVLAVALPFECTSDGTVFLTMVQPLGAGSGPANLAPFQNSLLVTSISPSREAHSFPLNQIPDLYDITDLGHFASDSEVIFLLRAAKGQNKTEHHLYIVSFSRDGEYEKTTRLEDDFEIYQIGVFPSGNYLAFGYDRSDHSPKLALLKEDGTLLEYLKAGENDLPKSLLGTLNNSGKGSAAYIAPTEFVAQEHSIYLVQLKTEFPLLEISESGAIRALHFKLPGGLRISSVIPSDKNLYVRVNGEKDQIKDEIYELDSETGNVLKKLTVSTDQSGWGIACVKGNNFLSFKDVKGKLVPLIGTTEAGN